VLGPHLSVLYTAGVTAIADMYNVCVHTYADDTHLDCSCPAADGATFAAQLLRCIDISGGFSPAESH